MFYRRLKKNLPDKRVVDVNWEEKVKEWEEFIKSPYQVKYPRVYQLETTSRCNLRCVMCPSQKMTRPRMDMEDELFDTIVERDLKWTKAVELFGFGEPLMDKKIGERVKKVQEKGIKVVLATNGLLISEENMDVIENVDYLVIDIDAMSEEGYKRVRGGDYKKLIENVELVLKRRKKYTVLQFIDINRGEEKKFLRRYSGRADEVRIKFLDTFAGQVIYKEEQKGVRCMEVFWGVSIWSNGDVVICDRDFDSKEKIGNLKEKSLIEIWETSEKLKRIQKLHKERRGEEVGICRYCREWGLTNLRNVAELTVNMFKGEFV